jgi:hypothetical protein
MLALIYRDFIDMLALIYHDFTDMLALIYHDFKFSHYTHYKLHTIQLSINDSTCHALQPPVPSILYFDFCF